MEIEIDTRSVEKKMHVRASVYVILWSNIVLC